jgi:lipoprotein
MKKKAAITVSTLLLLTVGGVTALNVINPSWRENTIFATARDKQLAWLKEHEEEIVKWIHSAYPKVESVQFDWNTLKVRPVSNGVSIIGYNLLVKGTFNDIPETIIFVDFLMETADSIPNMSQIRMNQPPSIKKADGGVYYFE